MGLAALTAAPCCSSSGCSQPLEAASPSPGPSMGLMVRFCGRPSPLLGGAVAGGGDHIHQVFPSSRKEQGRVCWRPSLCQGRSVWSRGATKEGRREVRICTTATT